MTMQRKRARFATALLTVSASLLFADPAHAQDAAASEEAPASSTSVVIKQDIFFGFHGIAQTAINVGDNLDATFYAILWTRPGFGAGGSGGNLWTEFGGGVNLTLLDGNLSVNPQLGILNGTLLSGAARGLAFEGIVPNLTATYGDGFFEGQVYAGYYISLRDLDGSNQNDFVHYWANAGVSVVSWLSAGIHWEHLLQTAGAASDSTEDVYQWIGPYVEARSDAGFIRFSLGADLVEDAAGDGQEFYQLAIGTSI